MESVQAKINRINSCVANSESERNKSKSDWAFIIERHNKKLRKKDIKHHFINKYEKEYF